MYIWTKKTYHKMNRKKISMMFWKFFHILSFCWYSSLPKNQLNQQSHSFLFLALKWKKKTCFVQGNMNEWRDFFLFRGRWELIGSSVLHSLEAAEDWPKFVPLSCIRVWREFIVFFKKIVVFYGGTGTCMESTASFISLSLVGGWALAAASPSPPPPPPEHK